MAGQWPESARSDDWFEWQRLIYRKQREFQARGNPHLIEDVAEMVLDRVLADLEMLGNFFVRVTGDHGGNNFQFAGRKAVFLLTRVRVRGLNEVSQILDQI